MDVRATIRAEVASVLAKRGDTHSFSDDESLLFTGRIDSLDVLELVAFLEKRFSYRIAADTFDPSQLDSVNGILGSIEASRA